MPVLKFSKFRLCKDEQYWSIPDISSKDETSYLDISIFVNNGFNNNDDFNNNNLMNLDISFLNLQ